MHKHFWSVALVGLLLVGSCSSSDDEADDGGDASASAPADDTTTTEGSSGGCPETTALEIVFGDAQGTEFDAITAWSDGGPHPDNTVDDDANMSFVFADYEIPIDEQFGYAIPIAGSEVPAEGTELQISLFLDSGIEAGTTYLDQTADDETLAEYDGEINFISLHEEGERAVLGETTITITEIDDEVVCGEISGVSSTDLQELTAVNGEFVADRVQALEAAAETDADD